MDKLKAIGQNALIALNIGYFDGNLYKLTLVNGKPSWQPASQQQFKPWILIAGRAYYEEQAKAYPIDNRREVNKLVSLELEQREGDSAFITFPPSDGKVSVNNWHFSPLLPQARIRVPESALLAWDAPMLAALTFQCQNQVLFAVNTPKGVVSSLRGGLIQDIDSFAIASGIALTPTSETETDSDKSHAENILDSLFKLLLRYPTAFVHSGSAQGDWQTSLNRLLFGAALGGALYLSVSSGYLMFSEHRITSQLEQQREVVNQSLMVQNQYHQLLSELESQRSFIASQQSTTPFWLVIEPLMQHARFRSLKYRNGRYQINGETDKATDLIDMLNRSPMVKDAKFDTQIRKSRKKEVFLISFLIENDAGETK